MEFPLTGDRIQLRPFVPADGAAMHNIYGDGRVMRWVGDGPVRDLNQTQAMLDRYIAHQRAHGFSFWAVVERSTGAVVGDAGLCIRGDDVELGYTLARAAGGAATRPRPPVCVWRCVWRARHACTGRCHQTRESGVHRCAREAGVSTQRRDDGLRRGALDLSSDVLTARSRPGDLGVCRMCAGWGRLSNGSRFGPSSGCEELRRLALAPVSSPSSVLVRRSPRRAPSCAAATGAVKRLGRARYWTRPSAADVVPDGTVWVVVSIVVCVLVVVTVVLVVEVVVTYP